MKPVGIVTGASRGLGLALARALAERDWRLVVDARGADALERAVARLEDVVAIPGDVTDLRAPPCARRGGRRADRPPRQQRGAARAEPAAGAAAYPLSELARVYDVNVFAPLALVQEALPRLVPGAAIVAISSDAAVEPYAGWGGYGSSKAALEQLTAILAVEQPRLRVYSVDPGDMRTQTYQEAFPGEDISHLPPPEESVPGLLALIEGSLRAGALPCARARGRCRVSALASPVRQEAHEPPEVRGLGRDDVAMLVATRHDLELVHSRFRELPRFLSAGDLLIVNTSATLPAALEARLGDERVQLSALDSRTGRHLARRAANGRAGALPATAHRRSTRPPRRRPGRAARDASPAANGSSPPASSSTSRSRTTFDDTAGRSATATSPSRGRSRPIRPSSPCSPGAPRCRAPAGPSRRSS